MSDLGLLCAGVAWVVAVVAVVALSPRLYTFCDCALTLHAMVVAHELGHD